MSVTLYSTPSCAYCRLAKEYFKSKGIPFTEYNVALDQRNTEALVRKSGKLGATVIDINVRVIIGFNKPEIDRALSR